MTGDLIGGRHQHGTGVMSVARSNRTASVSNPIAVLGCTSEQPGKLT